MSASRAADTTVRVVAEARLHIAVILDAAPRIQILNLQVLLTRKLFEYECNVSAYGVTENNIVHRHARCNSKFFSSVNSSIIIQFNCIALNCLFCQLYLFKSLSDRVSIWTISKVHSTKGQVFRFMKTRRCTCHMYCVPSLKMQGK